METVREKWTDERLDDLKEQVVTGFDRVHSDLQEIRGEVAGLRDGLGSEMKTEFAAVRAEIKTEFAAVRAEMKAEFAAVREEMKAEFAGVRAEMKAEFAAVRTEMKGESAGLRTEMREEFAAVRAEMAANHRLQVQLTLGTIGTVVLSFLGLLLSHA